jgi:cytochrome c oxidase assembly factor 3, fungi type
MSPGLKRARQPYLIRNALTGILVAAFGVGVWAYSISAVKQDVFDDVDEEARVLAAARRNDLASKAAPAVLLDTTPPATIVDPQRQDKERLGELPRGVLVKLLGRTFPSLFDPARKTLVWGAPSVDNVGKMWDRSSRK